jgi:fructose transport system permease protein
MSEGAAGAMGRERPPVVGALAAVRGQLQSSGTLGPLIALILLGAAFSLLSPRFLTAGNLSLVLQQVMEVGTLAVGQCLIILVAGIDLANGLVMVFATVVMAKLAVGGTPVPVAVLAGFALTIAFGVAEGMLVAILRLPAFIVTLGFLSVADAAAKLYTHETSIINLPPGLLVLGRSFPVAGAALPIGPIVMLVVFALAWYALTQTAWGRHVYAIGDNPVAARLTGVNTRLVLVSVYTIAGLIYAVAALLVLGRTNVGDPDAGATDNLDSITAVVLGGVSLFGGRGSIIGALIGALIVGILRNGLTLVGVDALFQTLATGVLVILAVVVDRLRARGGER